MSIMTLILLYIYALSYLNLINFLYKILAECCVVTP